MSVLTGRKSHLITPSDRLIVALDVPSPKEALAIVDELGDSVGFYKVGLELLMSGGIAELIRTLVPGRKVFADLKLPGDIPETIRRTVSVATDLGVTFLTLSHSAGPDAIAAAKAGRGERGDPQFLYVAFLSSQGPEEFFAQEGRPVEQFEGFFVEHCEKAKASGADGFIVSGKEIALLRRAFPDVLLVSPGIRPAGSTKDDHKRSCTPAEAIGMGADYIVVGRPITRAAKPREAAQAIVSELADAVKPAK
jgi:orotidine-5'-phosphate decarboxylase